MTATKTKQTAADRYAERQTECKDLLKRIASQMTKHQKEQKQKPADWGYTGDLARVAEQLAYALAALGDHTAADAKELER